LRKKTKGGIERRREIQELKRIDWNKLKNETSSRDFELVDEFGGVVPLRKKKTRLVWMLRWRGRRGIGIYL
jgi:hypothetical protein